MKIYAAAGLVVRDPATMTRIPAEGLDVPDTDPHWARLLRDGDVNTTAPELSSEEPAAPPVEHAEEDEA